MRGGGWFEPLDDDHAAAAAGAGVICGLRLSGTGADCFDGINGNYWADVSSSRARATFSARLPLASRP